MMSERSWNQAMSGGARCEPFEPLISHVKWFLRPWQKREASIVPTAPLSNRTAASTASSTSRPGMNVCVSAETSANSPTR